MMQFLIPQKRREGGVWLVNIHMLGREAQQKRGEIPNPLRNKRLDSKTAASTAGNYGNSRRFFFD
jgi:hypothetical protein